MTKYVSCHYVLVLRSFVQSQIAVTSHLKSKQLLLFGFARRTGDLVSWAEMTFRDV